MKIKFKDSLIKKYLALAAIFIIVCLSFIAFDFNSKYRKCQQQLKENKKELFEINSKVDSVLLILQD